MTKCHYCGHEEQSPEEKAWWAAAAKWNEYQSKEKIGWIWIGTAVVAVAFFFLAIITVHPKILSYFGWAGTIIVGLSGAKWMSAKTSRARAAFEKDFPDMAKLVR